MSRVGLWALGIGVLVSVGPVAVEPGYAGDNDGATRCNRATLKGRYLFTATGTVLPPAFGLQEGDPLLSVAGYHIFNGDGTGHDFVTVVLNGINLHLLPSAVTYILNSDCTGTYTVQDGANFDIFVSPNGDELAAVATDPGFVLVNPPSRRVAPK